MRRIKSRRTKRLLRAAEDRRYQFDMALFDCVDCGVNTCETNEYYMVHDELWPIGGNDGMLCIGCLETRLGRRLAPADFIDAPINVVGGGVNAHGDRLRDRLGYPPLAA
jgi:hypothetical protein